MLINVWVTALIFVGPSVCLGVVLTMTTGYARRVRKTTHLYTAVSLFGWLAGVLVGPLGLAALTEKLRRPGAALEGYVGWILIYVALLVGATVGALTGYVWLRMRTARDPDYDDRPSLLPHVGEPRDRGHLGPHQ
jgi:hypothetical protein